MEVGIAQAAWGFLGLERSLRRETDPFGDRARPPCFAETLAVSEAPVAVRELPWADS